MLKAQFAILAILLFFLHSSGQQQDGSVLERRVSLNQQNQPLAYILDLLSWQAGVFFSYDASIIDAEKKETIDVENKSLYTVLNKLFDSRKFIFSELQNQIIISENLDTNRYVSQTDTVPVKYFFLKGKIIESRKENAVQYASVSLLNKPTGTISNTEGEFLLKIHPDYIRDTVVISCLGYAQILIPAYSILDEDIFVLQPTSIRIREVKVTSTTPHQLLKNIRQNLDKNYSGYSKLMTAFYRETIKQDDNYINVSEAVLEILKAPYNNSRNDVVRLMKGRKSPDVQPFQWINFKLQGGPFTITQLDIVKTMERFIDEEYEELYKYKISKVIWYKDYPVYVLEFQPLSTLDFPYFTGELFVHRETFAILHAKFGFDKSGLKRAEQILIKKKPRGVKAKPSFVEYNVNYQQYQGKWHIETAKASVKIKVRSKHDKLNSEFQSVSDLLITNIQPTDLKRFTRDESIKRSDIFVEMLNDYDEEFWGNYNIIKPDEDLKNAFRNTSGF